MKLAATSRWSFNRKEPEAKGQTEARRVVETAWSAHRQFWEHFWASDAPGPLLQANTLELLTEIAPLVGALQPQVAVDVGCGEGRNLMFLGSIPSVRRIVALDISIAALRRSRRAMQTPHSGVQVDLVSADCTCMPLRQGAADLALASDLLNHLSSWRDAIAEFARILRPGGLLICNPLSVNDPAYWSVQTRGRPLGSGAFLVDDPRLLGGGGAYVMRFAKRLDLEEFINAGFSNALPIMERERIDPPHLPPFLQQEHRHVYWRLVYRRL